MCSCNGLPVRWAINPISTVAWERQRSCNAKVQESTDRSTTWLQEGSCNAPPPAPPGRRQYPGCCARQARTRPACNGPLK